MTCRMGIRLGGSFFEHRGGNVHLSLEQGDRFFDIMDALLTYVNGRFDVTPDFAMDYDDPLAEDKAQLIAAELWRNTAVIDDFVHENPFRLPARDLAAAADWKLALPGTFTLVRYQAGRALLMSEVGIFAVCGIDEDMDQVIGRAPATVRATLLPFEGQVIYDGFLTAGDVGLAVEREMEDEFERRVAQGIVADAPAFIQRVREWQHERQAREMDDWLAGLGGSDSAAALPEGFHRGALAGLAGEDRAAVLAGHVREIEQAERGSVMQAYRQIALNVEPSASLAKILLGYDRASLSQAAVEWGIPSAARLGKAHLAQALASAVLSHPEQLDDALVHAREATFSRMREAARACGGSGEEASAYAVALLPEDIGGPSPLEPIEPYSFFVQKGEGLSFVVPPEVLAMLADVDFGAVEARRALVSNVLCIADACATCCGAVSFGDAFAQYEAAFPGTLHEEEFAAILADEASFGDLSYELWRNPQTDEDFIIHFTLDRRYVARQSLNGGRQQELAFHLESTAPDENPDQAANRMYEMVRSAVAQDLGRLDELLLYLVAEHERYAMRPLPADMLSGDAMSALLRAPAAVAVRDYIDEHMPDGQDDFFYAESVVEEIVMLMIESGHSEAPLEYVRELGLLEGDSNRSKLPQLIEMLYNNVPSWENNGWSPRELTERLTGRTIFYDEDGGEMRIGPNDPCPCGSGKPYRRCHGR